jgi:hypothetical protein
MKPYKIFSVAFTAIYRVEALDKDEAIAIAIDKHEEDPVGFWEAIEDD